MLTFFLGESFSRSLLIVPRNDAKPLRGAASYPFTVAIVAPRGPERRRLRTTFVKTKHKQRFLLPKEYLGRVTAHPAIAEALRRGRPALAVVWAIPVAAYFCRGMRKGDWGWSVIGVAISAGFGYLLWRAIVTGYTRTNHGEFHRATRPFGYWLSILFLVLGYAVGIAGLLLADYGT